jgi:hypothetical protein
MYREKATGARGDRREPLKMLDGLAAVDVATVKHIDRPTRIRVVERIVDS